MSGETMRKEYENEDSRETSPAEDEFAFDPKKIRPSGHARADGFMRLSFTLPMPMGNKTRAVARNLTELMGFKNVILKHLEAIDRSSTLCVIEAQTDVVVDSTAVLPDEPVRISDRDSLSLFVEDRLHRKIVVAGACLGIESDSVVMDTIFTMAGYMGEPGLEAYPCFAARNLRASLDPEALVHKLAQVQADAILICKVGSKASDPQVDLRRFERLLYDAKGVSDHLVKICVSPRMTVQMAEDMGYDAGFGAGTLPSQVAEFISQTVIERV